MPDREGHAHPIRTKIEGCAVCSVVATQPTPSIERFRPLRRAARSPLTRRVSEVDVLLVRSLPPSPLQSTPEPFEGAAGLCKSHIGHNVSNSFLVVMGSWSNQLALCCRGERFNQGEH